MGGMVEFARETEEINRQTAGIRRLRLEMEAERLEWERALAAVAAHERQEADRYAADADAETLGAR